MKSWLKEAPRWVLLETHPTLPSCKGAGPLMHPLAQGRAPHGALWLTPGLVVSRLQPHHPEEARESGGSPCSLG